MTQIERKRKRKIEIEKARDIGRDQKERKKIERKKER